MLNFIRTHRTLFSIFFVLAGTAMVVSMFGNPSNMRGGNSLASGIAAKVDGEEITVQSVYSATLRQREQLQENIEDQVSKSENKAETRKFLDQLLKSQVSPDRILGELINEKFQLRASERVGIDVPPEAIVDILQKTPYFQKEGRFDPLLYKSAVSQPGLYEAELRQRAKQYALNRAFLSSLALLSPEEQKAEAWLKKRLNLETLVIDPTKLSDVAKPTAAEVSAFAADAAQATKLQAYYDRNIRKYKTDEQVKARHILFKIEKADQLAAEKQANEVLADIKAKKITFDEAAKKYSADKSNANKGGELGFFGKGMMDPAFEAAAFGLKNNGDLLDKAVRSSFGFHLIERQDYKAAVAKSLADAKTEIAEAVLTEQKRGEKARSWAKAISDGKAPADAELKKLGMSWAPVTWSPLDSSLGAVGNVDEYRAKILTLTSSNPYLSQILPQGENLVVVRLAANAKVDPKKTTEDDLSPAKLAQDKAVEALQYFLKAERERLEKAKKIVRDDRAIMQLKQAMGDNAGMPEGR